MATPAKSSTAAPNVKSGKSQAPKPKNWTSMSAKWAPKTPR